MVRSTTLMPEETVDVEQEDANANNEAADVMVDDILFGYLDTWIFGGSDV